MIRSDPGELLLPSVPKPPGRLYRWRVNDVEFVTPVPRPIADTLSFNSSIGDETRYEQCSTAPLPCTPYIPSLDVRLREPRRGVSGGFVRDPGGSAVVTGRAHCLGEVASAGPELLASTAASAAAASGR
jgi:hypothetical protein